MATTTSRVPGNLKLPDAAIRFAWTITGATTTSTKGARMYNTTGYTLTIADVRCSIVTAPVGSTYIVDVNKDGTTLFTTQADRPTIADGGNTSTTTAPAVTTIASGSYLTFDVDQVGSGTAGSNLVVEVLAYATAAA